MPKSLSQNFLCSNDIFNIIRQYQNLNFNYCLKQILLENTICIPDLHRKLNKKGYRLTLESLYRYFNPNPNTNRFPPKEFIKVFSEILQLNDEEEKILLLFWQTWNLSKFRSCNCKLG
jgi:hypothetical protein